jgi:hypothetical protein
LIELDRVDEPLRILARALIPIALHPMDDALPVWLLSSVINHVS